MSPSNRSCIREARAAAGYASILIAPLLLTISATLNTPFLVIGTVLLVFPLLRYVFGVVPQGPAREWPEGIAEGLDALCALHVVAFVAALAMVLAHVAMTAPTFLGVIGWTLSLWITSIFATCVAHEMLHRRGKRQRLLGHLLAGICGYPILGYEHARHHRLPGNTAAAEWPRLDDSFWQFGWRRLRALIPETLGHDGHLLRGDPRSPSTRGLRVATAAMVATWIAFAGTGSFKGLIIYAGVVVLVSWSIQLVTYMQHWGLGDDNREDARLAAWAWENDCRFQAWVTVGLSLHHSHHQQGTLPHYRVGLASNSPRLPMGYVLLMFTAFVPSLWRRIMLPVLADWQTDPDHPVSAGRKLICVSHYR